MSSNYDENNNIQNSTKPLDKPFGTKISSITNEGIEFYWKKLENTDGYEIYRSYEENGPFELIKAFDNRRIGTYIDTEFDRSKKVVYYSIKTFINNDDGSVTHSEMIEPKKAEFKENLIPEREITYMYSGSTRNIKALYGWGEAVDTSWTSSDENVATVDNNGDVTAVAKGTCVLTCIDNATGMKTTSNIEVDRSACQPLSEIKSRYAFDEQSGVWKNENSQNSNDALILMVGDLMCGRKQMTTQYDEQKGWCFNDSYEFVKDVFASSDLAVANLETLLASGWPYMTDECYINNYNNCNVTSRYLDAVKYAGFDLVTMSNNHNCDGGLKALIETIEQVDKYKLIRTGAFLYNDKKRYVVVDVNGIKVGYVAYTSSATGFNKKEKSWSDLEKDTLLNIFSYDKAKKDIEACRNAGAEYVIAYMHWGLKNYKTPTDNQVVEAKEIANAGADYIVGANPHVLQKYENIISDDGRTVPCFYSTGNFQSIMNQIPENRDSVIVRIRLNRDENGKVVLAENNYIPCHTYTSCKECNWTPIVLSKKLFLGYKKKYRLDYINRISKTIGNGITAY